LGKQGYQRSHIETEQMPPHLSFACPRAKQRKLSKDLTHFRRNDGCI